LLILAVILVAYEVFEILFVYIAFMIFRPETIKDQFTDIFLGVAGGLLCFLFLALVRKFHKRYPEPVHAFIFFVISSSYAFIWVGSYHYKYNVSFYNTPVINISTLIGWTVGGMFILYMYRLFRKRYWLIRISLTWMLYFLALMVFEYFFYYILEVRETSGHPLKPLLFGLVHGTRTLHVFYIIVPFILVAVYEFGLWLVSRASAISLLSAR
jgi:uncharacterized membrane protein YeaQ/YmgE (transglycosylase-associated protein family)